MTPDLSALNGTERRVLLLLGRGHTAKSIASATGLSVNAVNERLREARRKTGVGSSRELARLLRARETWDEETGVSGPPPSAPSVEPPEPHGTAGWTKGRIAMASFCLGAAAVAALLFVTQAGTGAPPRVVATGPGQDGRVPVGPFTLSVTFDRPMRGDGWSLVGDPRFTPDCAQPPRLSPDARTFTFACRAERGRNYLVSFNGGRFRNFRGRDGSPSEPYPLRFSAR